VNLEENNIYEDVGVQAYSPDKKGRLRKFNPIGTDIFFNLKPDAEIDLQPDAGC